jgi:hypothetical protein
LHYQCEFYTKNERIIVELLKGGPKQYSEIVDAFPRGKKGEKRKSTVNNLLKKMEAGNKIFQIEIEGKSFYRLDTFPLKIHAFFKLVDWSNWPELIKIKNDVLLHYPEIGFEKILRIHREATDPVHKGIIQLLKMFESDKYCN